MEKIRYRLVYCYSGKLNRQGMAPVTLECRQGSRKIYISSKVMLYPYQWDKGMVTNHDLSCKLTAYLVRWRNSVEETEINMLLKGQTVTLRKLKDAIRYNIKSNASLRDFTCSVIANDSSRCQNTKKGYKYLINDITKQYGELSVEDVDYDLIVRYRESMRKKGLSENTVKGRLKLIRCILEQARIREIIDRNPFEMICIGNMTPKEEYLDMNEVRRIERLHLEGKEELVRDLFLLSCFTGLRFSDLASLEEAELDKGILRKRMKKTKHVVSIPIDTLFWGKGRAIWDKYPDIRKLSHCCCNTTFNRVIKEIGKKAGVKKNLHAHIGRKSFSNLLREMGLSVDDVSTILGHTETKVTRRHYLFNDDKIMEKAVRKLFKK